jgi:hypothetical protein
LRAAIEKLAASKQQQAEASEKSIEDDSPEKGKKLRLLNLLQETTFLEPEVYASAAQKWLPQKLLKQLMLQLLKEW